jgi:hypothetical protein
MLGQLQSINAIKILKQEQTEGSAPLLVLCEDTDLYYAKSTIINPPRVELINEIICYYFALCWKINIPSISIINIGQEVARNFSKDGGVFEKRYREEHFNFPFFGSKMIAPTIELEQYFNGLERKTDIKKFIDPLDLIKIGVFDIWVGNKDRKPQNPNILLSVERDKIQFFAIDHTAAFCFLSDYMKVTDALLRFDESFRILRIPLVKSISKFVDSKKLESLKENILACMETSINNIDFIFEQVPAQYGFSKRSKNYLKMFFSDRLRNERVAKSYLYYTQ